jgi:hypothetical protein
VQRDLAGAREIGDPRSHHGADDGHVRAGQKEAIEFLIGDLAAADDQTRFLV